MAHILLTIPFVRLAADRKILQVSCYSSKKEGRFYERFLFFNFQEVFFKKTVGEVAIERLLGELMRH